MKVSGSSVDRRKGEGQNHDAVGKLPGRQSLWPWVWAQGAQQMGKMAGTDGLGLGSWQCGLVLMQALQWGPRQLGNVMSL